MAEAGSPPSRPRSCFGENFKCAETIESKLWLKVPWASETAVKVSMMGGSGTWEVQGTWGVCLWGRSPKGRCSLKIKRKKERKATLSPSHWSCHSSLLFQLPLPWKKLHVNQYYFHGKPLLFPYFPTTYELISALEIYIAADRLH